MERGAYRGRGRNSYGGGRGSYGGDRDGNGDHNSYGGGRGGYGGGRSNIGSSKISEKKMDTITPDLVVKENPLKQCVSLRRCFFPMNPPLRKKDLNHGIMAIGGFQQSLSLLLRDCPCAWTIRRQVEHVLIGLKVNVKHRKTKQKYTITRLTPKDIPALDFGGNKTNFVPMELCELVEGQRYPKENLDKYAAKDLKGMSVAPPRVRQSTIQAMVNSEDGPCG
ncbi:hypothetical protein GYH30_054545 [Glycine max]|nr:hypothetical protein GYH30_054545 [Glycine max]